MDWDLGKYEYVAQQLLPAANEAVAHLAPAPNEAIGDVGCGTGNAALIAASMGAVVTGIDPSPRLLEVARRDARSKGLDVDFRILFGEREAFVGVVVAAVNIEGIAVRDLAKFLMDKYHIIVVPLVGGAPPNQVFDYQALRVSPNIYTTLEEIDTFVAAMEDALKNGVPATQSSRGGATEEWYA